MDGIQVAIREKDNCNAFQSTITLLSCFKGNSIEQDRISIREDSECVDGIGGITWEGSLLMSFLLSMYDMSGSSVIELGAGAGLCSIALANDPVNVNSTVVCTDRFIDLGEANAHNNYKSQGNSSKLACLPLTWGCSNDGRQEEQVLQALGTLSPDIIFGAEIACLRAQQEALVNTIRHLCARSDGRTVILIGFDELPQPNGVTAEKEFDVRMSQIGYRKAVLCSAYIAWTDCGYRTQQQTQESEHERETGSRSKAAIITMFDSKYPCSDTVSQPIRPYHIDGSVQMTAVDSGKGESVASHVVAYYRTDALRTCRMCHRHFLPSLCRLKPQLQQLDANGCRYHSGYYVCRYHPAETRLSIAAGDGLGYYGNGQEGWDAKFWDCCGATDPSAEGCCLGRHISYDE